MGGRPCSGRRPLNLAAVQNASMKPSYVGYFKQCDGESLILIDMTLRHRLRYSTMRMKSRAMPFVTMPDTRTEGRNAEIVPPAERRWPASSLPMRYENIRRRESSGLILMCIGQRLYALTHHVTAMLNRERRQGALRYALSHEICPLQRAKADAFAVRHDIQWHCP